MQIRLIHFTLLSIVALSCCIPSALAQRPGASRDLGTSLAPNAGNPADSTAKKDLQLAYYSLEPASERTLAYDTSLNDIHKIEPLYRIEEQYGTTGSENGASYGLMWLPDRNTGIRLGQDSYFPVFYRPELDRIYVTNRPFWSFHFGQGFQLSSTNIDARFYKQFARGIQLNFNYRILSDEGLDSRFSNDYKNMDLKLAQITPDGRRKSTAIYRSFKIDDDFNLSGVTGFGETTKAIRESGAFLFVNEFDHRDSARKNGVVWNNRVDIGKERYRFNDNQLSAEERLFFPLPDSINELNYENKLSHISFDNSYTIFRGNTQYELSADLAFFNHQQSGYSADLLSLKLGGGVRYKLNGILLEFDSHIGLADASGSGGIGLRASQDAESSAFSLSIDLMSQIPASNTQSVYLNAGLFRENLLLNSRVISAEGNYTSRNLGTELKLHYLIANRQLIWQPDLNILQLDSPVKVLGLSLHKDLNVGRIKNRFGFNYQYISELRVQGPGIFASYNVYIDFHAFKKRMESRLGADLSYTPSFITPGYSHLIGQTVYNESSSNSSGSILLLNPYISFKVHKFYAFLKANNALNRLFTGPRYWYTDFPIYDFRIVFGIRWDLLD